MKSHPVSGTPAGWGPTGPGDEEIPGRGYLAAMSRLPMRSTPSAPLLEGFAAIREELGIPVDFDPEVLKAAELAVEGVSAARPRAGADPVDRTEIEFVTIDPPESMDLDQAVHIETREDGYRVHYAISDPAAFIGDGDPVNAESLRRGLTLYSPDGRTPLHPAVLSEGAASLLPGQDRPSILWTLDLDATGELRAVDLRRAIVRSREKLSYRGAAAMLDTGEASRTLLLLREVGLLRAELERKRGGVSLNLPGQEVIHDGDCYRLVWETKVDIEDWNAQISLLTGMAAASIMVEGGIGLLRILPGPEPGVLGEIRHAALALGIDWPEDMDYAERVRTLEPNIPSHASLLSQAVRALRGADYVFFDGEIPEHSTHWAIAARYAHVTAPLRRVGDRFTNEVCLALHSGTEIPAWALEGLPRLPDILRDARRREGSLERAMVDFVESMILADRVGEVFEATVTKAVGRGRSRIQIPRVAVSADIEGRLEPGARIKVRLVAADPARRTISLELVD